MIPSSLPQTGSDLRRWETVESAEIFYSRIPEKKRSRKLGFRFWAFTETQTALKEPGFIAAPALG
jgi:hypothetical protein